MGKIFTGIWCIDFMAIAMVIICVMLMIFCIIELAKMIIELIEEIKNG